MQDDVIKVALERGVLSREQADALRGLSAEIIGKAAGTARDNLIAPRDDEPARPHDDEDLKFVGGFGDIFVTIGIVLFMGALAYFAGKLGALAGTRDIEGMEAACLATGGAAWGLAEYFTRKRRMALPSIVLLINFIASCFILFALVFSSGRMEHLLKDIGPDAGAAERWAAFGIIFATCMATAISAAIYYWRFRVPVAVAGAVAVLGGIVISLIATVSPEFAKHYTRYIILLFGLGVFVLAMRFDMSDTLRRTRRTDIAFWLHLLAAPLIVHPMLNPLVRGEALTAQQAASIIGVFLLLGCVAIVIDRRAVLVSSLIYAGISFATLFKGSGLASFANESFPLTLLTLGSFILLISVGWHPIRRLVLGWLPAGFTSRLYNPYAQGAAG